MDPTTVEGSARQFASLMAEGDLTAAAEVTDPESPARDELMEMVEQLERLENNPDAPAGMKSMVIGMFAAPYRDARVEVVTEEGDLAVVNYVFGEGEDARTVEARFAKFEDLWLLNLTEDLLQPSQSEARNLGERLGGGGSGGGADEGGGRGDGDAPGGGGEGGAGDGGGGG
jgi:hypothetical protein